MKIQTGKAYFNGKYCDRCGCPRVSTYGISAYSTETGEASEFALRDECVHVAKVVGNEYDCGHYDSITRHPVSLLLHYDFPTEGMERYRWFIPFFLRPIENLLKEKGVID